MSNSLDTDDVIILLCALIEASHCVICNYWMHRLFQLRDTVMNTIYMWIYHIVFIPMVSL